MKNSRKLLACLLLGCTLFSGTGISRASSRIDNGSVPLVKRRWGQVELDYDIRSAKKPVLYSEGGYQGYLTLVTMISSTRGLYVGYIYLSDYIPAPSKIEKDKLTE